MQFSITNLKLLKSNLWGHMTSKSSYCIASPSKLIDNGNLFKNGGAECDEICKHYGMDRIKTIFWGVFQGYKHTMLSLL